MEDTAAFNVSNYLSACTEAELKVTTPAQGSLQKAASLAPSWLLETSLGQHCPQGTLSRPPAQFYDLAALITSSHHMKEGALPQSTEQTSGTSVPEGNTVRLSGT